MPTYPCRLPLRPWILSFSLLLAACTASPPAPETAFPQSVDALLAEGDAAVERGDWPQAARSYRMAAESSDDERVAEQAAETAFRQFQLREALLAAERWLTLNSTSDQARRLAGASALDLHRLDVAEARVGELLATGFISPAAGFLALLPALSAQGTPADVTELFRRLTARYPDMAEGQLALGGAALRSENFGLAIDSAMRARELAPYWLPPRMLEARARVVAGDVDTGLAIARDAVLSDDADLSTQLEYAALLASAERDDEVRALLTPYVTGDTVIPGALYTLAMLDLQADDLQAATLRFEQLLATGAQSQDALYFLGAIAEKRGDPEAAMGYYSRVDEGSRSLAARQRSAALRAAEAGPDAGLAELEDLAQEQPQLGPELAVAQAGLMSSLGDEGRALAILNEGIEIYPDVVDLRMARVFLLERTGEVDAALRELRRLLDERPGDAVVQNALGYTLADHERELGTARDLVTQALAQMPDSSAVLDSMGWVLYRQGLYEDAIGYLQRAEEHGSDPEIYLHLGEVEWKLGRREAAIGTWESGLERYPGNSALQDRLERARR